MNSRRIMPTLIGCTALVTLALAAGGAEAKRGNHGRGKAAPQERCGHALTTSHQQVLGRETSLLSRCARALAEQEKPKIIKYRCSRLAQNGVGADRIERIARKRVEAQCSMASLPSWLPALCPARGPELGAIVADSTEAASCALSSGRCMALTATADLFGDIIPHIREAVPSVLTFELGGVAGHTFDACASPAPTTTTLPPTTTTTTTSTSTLPAPTTTTTSTTTLPAPTTTTTSTTTLPEPTTTTTTSTTLPQPTTTTTSTTLPEPEAPSIVVTEIMTNPAAQSDTAGEYFEIENTGTAALELEGITFKDLGSNSFTVNTSVVVLAGARAVLGRSATAADGMVDYVYGSAMSLGNSADQILVEHEGVVLDEVAWDAAFPLVAGASMELAATATDPLANDAASVWCASSSLLADGDYGTPGAEPAGCLVQP